MNSLAITIKSPIKNRRVGKFLIEIDAERLERLAANLGFFSSDFLKSIERAEKDYRLGKMREVKSLKELVK